MFIFDYINPFNNFNTRLYCTFETLFLFSCPCTAAKEAAIAEAMVSSIGWFLETFFSAVVSKKATSGGLSSEECEPEA